MNNFDCHDSSHNIWSRLSPFPTPHPVQAKLQLGTMKPRFNEPLYNEVLGKVTGKKYRTEPRYNEILVITNINRKPKRKIYPDITNN
jgi:hypothetical protein